MSNVCPYIMLYTPAHFDATEELASQCERLRLFIQASLRWLLRTRGWMGLLDVEISTAYFVRRENIVDVGFQEPFLPVALDTASRMPAAPKAAVTGVQHGFINNDGMA